MPSVLPPALPRALRRALLAAALLAGTVAAGPSGPATASPAPAAAPAAAPLPVCAPGTYFALEAGGGIRRAQLVAGTPPAQQPSYGAFPVETRWSNPPTVGVDAYGPANALGVRPDGTLYALQPSVDWSAGNGQGRWYADIYRRSPDGTTAKVVDRYWYDSGRYDSGGRQLTFRAVGGAVDPASGAYFFMNVQERTDTRSGWALDVFRYDDGRAVRLVASVEIPAGEVVRGGAINGDIDFDDHGNLYFVMSGNGRSRLISVSRERLDAAPGDGRVIQPSATSGTFTTPSGLSYNGIAFNEDGSIVVQAGRSGTSTTVQATFDPNTLRQLSTAVSTDVTAGSDLASCQSPGTLRLEKEVVGRDLPDDQFELGIHRIDGSTDVPTASATTTGTANGLQAEVAGPVPASAGATYELREASSRSGGLADYATTWRCVDRDSGQQLSSGTGSTIRIAAFPRGGVDVSCRFVNTPLGGPMTTGKSVDPRDGTTVSPGQLVAYTLSFDNTAGRRAADVDHTDVLTGVLDDADLVPGSLAAQGPLTATLDGDRIRIGGSVPAGATRTVTYQVRVKDAADLGDRVLRNLLVPGDPPDPPCTDENSCTENPVEDAAWTLGKAAEPTSGTEVQPGDVVAYAVTASVHRGVVPDAVVTDDLGAVLDSASFVAGSATLTVDGGTPVAVPDPSGTVLRTAPFRLAAGQTAVLRYRVGVDDDAWARTLRNVVTGTGATPPERCAPGDPPTGCSTEHPTPAPGITLPATGGAGTGPLRLAGVLLLITTAAGLLRRHLLTSRK